MAEPAQHAETTKQAELPKQYDHAAAEGRWFAFWRERGYFNSDPDPRRKPYTIVIPPPNVTGALHLGHALNNTLQDTLIRWRRMQGYNALWMPGSDHAGIATQAVVERRLFEEEKKTRHDLGRAALVERIWAWKNEYEQRILSQLAKMGASCDWRRTRFTLDEMCTRAVRHTFFRMFRDGKIYRGKRLVNWDAFLQTAVSDDEVFHETVAGHFWHFRYAVIDPRPGEPTHVTIATTRPETMLGDTAVAVHPDPARALDAYELSLRVKMNEAGERDWPAVTAQMQDLAERRHKLLPQLERLRDMAKAGRRLMLPLVNRPIPLVADEWAKPELGSGCVKITPAHDPNDYEVGKRQGLPMINILNPDGTLNAAAGPYAGLTIAKARAAVVADLEAAGLMDKVEDREIELAHSDRSKTPIEPYLADQWFVRMEELAQSAMDAVTDGRVKITPARYASGYLDWLGEKRDWPVSRQLWWGHRIPVWSQRVADAGALARLEAALAKQTGVDPEAFAYCVEPNETLQAAKQRGGADDEQAKTNEAYATIHVCLRDDDAARIAEWEGQGFAQSDDVLDTWFSSALWPHSTLGWPAQTPELAYYYPTSVLSTSRDIITLWVARMVLTGLYNVGDVPFRQVFVHPKILDGFGETMSKSKGNGVDPIDVIDKFGADALRFGLAYVTTETQDVRMPVEFECPHCQTHIEQTKKNRVQPRLECKQCGQPFSTQWASKPADLALPRAAVVNERFEVARNFCNKLWNAARFTLINLDGYKDAPTRDAELAIEDRWLLSRLATVTRETTTALEQFRFGDAARTLYDFAWNEFCSFYVEMVKSRLSPTAGAASTDSAASAAETRAVAQRVLAHSLDTLLRLLHPIVPFVTEEIWQLLALAAPRRGLERPAAAAASVMIAPWPTPDDRHLDPRIESQFAQFQSVLAGLREIRSRQNKPKTPITFTVRCDAATAALLEPLAPYFQSMTGATAKAWGPQAEAPASSVAFSAAGLEVFVDPTGLIDWDAEQTRLEKERTRLEGAIAAKQRQLANEKFVSRAPAEVIQKERAALAQLSEQLALAVAALAALRKDQGGG